MATLQEIRAKLKEQENRQSGSNTDNSIFPFWNMKEGETSVVRFLPDGNVNNDFFWQDRLIIKLPFAGVKGQTDSRPVVVQVPCMEMYNQSCPVLSEVRGWFKDSSMEELGRKYWKKRSYIFQHFVVDSPLQEETTPENPIRRTIIGPQIFQMIKSALLDPDMEHLPTDYVNGLDFRITKGSKGSYADYATSTWARRERPLNEKELGYIDQFGLFDLSEFIPKKPTDAEVKIIAEMFEASVDGEVYDPDRFGQYFKPYGLNVESSNTPAREEPTKAVETKSVDTDDIDPPFDTDTVTKTTEEKPKSGNAQDILAMIRARQGQ